METVTLKRGCWLKPLLNAGNEIEVYKYPALGDHIYSQAKYHDIKGRVTKDGTAMLVELQLLGAATVPLNVTVLVPRVIPVLGLIGAPLLICTVIATVFGGFKLGSPELAALPVAAWELSLGVWLVVKGFRPAPITTDSGCSV